MTFIGFVEGPLFYFAALVFVIAGLWRFFGIIAIGRKRDLAPARGSALAGFIGENLRHFVPRGLFASRTAIHLIAGYAFHIGLFVLLIFAAPHMAFFGEKLLGVTWPVLPRWGFIIAAQFAFAGLMVLWVRRFSDPVMRKISDMDDHVGSWLTFLVMLTGCLALQQSHVFLKAVHMLFVDIWLIYFPFSRLMHAVTFVLSRGYTGSTYGRKGMIP